MITLMAGLKKAGVWVWKHKAWALNAVLLLILVLLGLKNKELSNQVQTVKLDHAKFVHGQEVVTNRLNQSWKERLYKAQEGYLERIKVLERDKFILSVNADRLSKSLAEAKSKYHRASEEARIEYTSTLSDVFGSCVEAYRGMAAKADGHANDAKLLEEAWPTIEKPP